MYCKILGKSVISTRYFLSEKNFAAKDLFFMHENAEEIRPNEMENDEKKSIL